MTRKRPKSAPMPAAPAAGYAGLLAAIKERVAKAQVRAHVAVSRELNLLYWQIGRDIVERQKSEKWGKSVVERLAADIQKAFLGIEGFSGLNVWRMRAFYLAWQSPSLFLSQPVTELKGHPGPSSASDFLSRAATEMEPSVSSPFLAQPVTELPPPEILALPWSHNLILIQKIKDPATRLWYAAKVLENGWSRSILTLQIESVAHKRHGKAITNFKQTLPDPQSDLAEQIVKDPYHFGFLTLGLQARERDLELGLMEHLSKFLLELGIGFALVGRQIHMEIGDQDFYLDLLFYHWKLRCFVVIDLKAREFTPEAAGKMNFYLSAVDDLYRQPGDQPSIGLILCRTKNRIIAEYALRDVSKPIGVSGYVTKLVETLPKTLKGSIPSIREIESGLSVSPVAKKKHARKRAPRKPKI